jgi:sugar (pentulose or hexulose) kinase
MSAHGGMFRTAGVAQRFLAAALDAPVEVAESASEGGAWGVAVLAAFTASGSGTDLAAYLTDTVFATTESRIVQPGIDDVAGFTAYLDRYRAGLAVELAAVTAL